MYERVFAGFQNKVTDEVNADITRGVTEDEIQEVMFDIGPHRALEPDGFIVVLYHFYWDDLKIEILEEVQQFFAIGDLDKETQSH